MLQDAGTDKLLNLRLLSVFTPARPYPDKRKIVMEIISVPLTIN